MNLSGLHSWGDRVERSIDVGHVQHGILTNNLPSVDLLAGGGPIPPHCTNSIYHCNRNPGQNHIPDSSVPLAYLNGHPGARRRSPPYDKHRSKYTICLHGYTPECAAQPLLYPSIRPQPPPGVGIHSGSANVADQGRGPLEMKTDVIGCAMTSPSIHVSASKQGKCSSCRVLPNRPLSRIFRLEFDI